MRSILASVLWKLPLALLIMSLATWAYILIKVATGNDLWNLAFAFGTPLLVSAAIREKNGLYVALTMFGAFAVFFVIAFLVPNHGQALIQHMAQGIMPIPGMIILIGVPWLLIRSLIRKLRSRKEANSD